MDVTAVKGRFAAILPSVCWRFPSTAIGGLNMSQFLPKIKQKKDC